MSLPWSAMQVECLREMGLDVLVRRDAGGTRESVAPADDAPSVRAPTRADRPQAGRLGGGIDSVLQRVARGVDLAPLLAAGTPRDVASRRALWRALRPLRKEARLK